VSDIDLLDIFGHDIGEVQQAKRGKRMTSNEDTMPNTSLAVSLVLVGVLNSKHLPLRKTDDLLEVVSDIANKNQEHLICLSLDSGSRLIARRTITIGLLNVSLAHPREVFAGAVVDRAAAIVIAHNHPSGIAEPSEGDIEVTQQLAAAGQLLGISLKDHIIVCKKNFYSFAAEGLLASWDLYRDMDSAPT
jgi:DNA repair protein RadC